MHTCPRMEQHTGKISKWNYWMLKSKRQTIGCSIIQTIQSRKRGDCLYMREMANAIKDEADSTFIYMGDYLSYTTNRHFLLVFTAFSKHAKVKHP
jgi:hypothetical protein